MNVRESLFLKSQGAWSHCHTSPLDVHSLGPKSWRFHNMPRSLCMSKAGQEPSRKVLLLGSSCLPSLWASKTAIGSSHDFTSSSHHFKHCFSGPLPVFQKVPKHLATVEITLHCLWTVFSHLPPITDFLGKDCPPYTFHPSGQDCKLEEQSSWTPEGASLYKMLRTSVVSRQMASKAKCIFPLFFWSSILRNKVHSPWEMQDNEKTYWHHLDGYQTFTPL